MGSLDGCGHDTCPPEDFCYKDGGVEGHKIMCPSCKNLVLYEDWDGSSNKCEDCIDEQELEKEMQQGK